MHEYACNATTSSCVALLEGLTMCMCRSVFAVVGESQKMKREERLRNREQLSRVSASCTRCTASVGIFPSHSYSVHPFPLSLPSVPFSTSLLLPLPPFSSLVAAGTSPRQ